MALFEPALDVLAGFLDDPLPCGGIKDRAPGIWMARVTDTLGLRNLANLAACDCTDLYALLDQIDDPVLPGLIARVNDSDASFFQLLSTHSIASKVKGH
jgi:hypothetical protein